MAGNQDQLEIKFRLSDGSDIGPKSFPSATSIATLKESLLAQWPEDKEYGPRTVKDVKLISGGRILENNRTVGECQSPLCDQPGGVTTMHVIVQPPVEKEYEGKSWHINKVAAKPENRLYAFGIRLCIFSLLRSHQVGTSCIEKDEEGEPKLNKCGCVIM